MNSLLSVAIVLMCFLVNRGNSFETNSLFTRRRPFKVSSSLSTGRHHHLHRNIKAVVEDTPWLLFQHHHNSNPSRQHLQILASLPVNINQSIPSSVPESATTVKDFTFIVVNKAIEVVSSILSCNSNTCPVHDVLLESLGPFDDVYEPWAIFVPSSSSPTSMITTTAAALVTAAATVTATTTTTATVTTIDISSWSTSLLLMVSSLFSCFLEDPNFEVEVLIGLSHIVLDLTGLLLHSTSNKSHILLIRFSSILGRIFILSADYIPDHSIYTEELLFQLIFLFVSIKDFISLLFISSQPEEEL